MKVEEFIGVIDGFEVALCDNDGNEYNLCDVREWLVVSAQPLTTSGMIIICEEEE